MSITDRETARRLLEQTADDESIPDKEQERISSAYGKALQIARHEQTADGSIKAEDLGLEGREHYGAHAWDQLEQAVNNGDARPEDLAEREGRFAEAFNKLSGK